MSDREGLQPSDDQLAYLNRMTVTGHVLPNVAHELNNALQVISGLVEMLAARGDLPADVKERLARIGTQSGRAVGLVRELVAFARGEDHGVRTFDLAHAVEQALSLRRYQLSRARIAVQVEPTELGTLRVRGDAHGTRQALLNLIINAEQAVAGRAEPRLTIAFRARESFVEVIVEDNGAGLPAPVARQMHRPFFSTSDGMAGLGLPVARLLAERQGGELRVEEVAGGGTRALIAVPRADA